MKKKECQGKKLDGFVLYLIFNLKVFKILK